MTMMASERTLLLAPLLLACSTSDPIPPNAECEGFRVSAAPTHAISPERLEARRAAALDSLGLGVLIAAAGWQMDHAVGDPERQNSDFYWLTGLSDVEEGWLVLIATAEGNETRLYLRGNDEDPAALPVVDVTGTVDVRCMDDAAADIRQLADELPTALLTREAAESDALWDALSEAGMNAGDGNWLMSELRAVKDDEEIVILEEAARITAQALLRGMKAAEPGAGEADVEEAIHEYMMDHGATRLAFGHIVASDSNALEFHYRENDDQLDAGELIVVDVGAELGRYAADVARTFPASGTFTPRQRELYDFLLTALDAGIAAAHVGGSMQGVHQAILVRLAQSGDLCGVQTCNYHLGHAGGHYVGLDVHDGISSANWTLPLRPGSILNVEPGIYLPAEGIGLRIEETVLVTEDGPRVLSVGVPVTAEEIEAAMATP